MSSYHFHVTFFFFNDTATTEIYTLSLHDALPICAAFDSASGHPHGEAPRIVIAPIALFIKRRDRKSTRLNSSHSSISYAVFCLKKKKKPIELINQNKQTVYLPNHLSIHHLITQFN